MQFLQRVKVLKCSIGYVALVEHDERENPVYVPLDSIEARP
jgi:hypothetical protein